MSGADWALAAGLLLSLAGTGYAFRRLTFVERQLRRRAPGPAATPGDRSLQRVGLVRYQAYHDVGGDHSFSLALLDAEGAGVVINSLYHRDRCRIYAKPVQGWASPITLTDEETEAIDRARAGIDAVDTPKQSR
ncbi:MAG: DUF4446 family protein [Chloroflexi bacterium]|nr:MAG: DUF4446 family protein [Chloroflexota bacterium]